MDNYFSCLLLFFLFGLDGVMTKNLAAPLNFWNSPKEKVEEYRRNGRTCGPCHFPFEHKNQSHYACFKETEEEGFRCRNEEGDYVGCPEDCPEGTVIYSYMGRTLGANNTFVIQCSVWGSPNPTGYWRKNGEVVEVVPPPEDPYLVQLSFSISLRYDEEDYGKYSCYAENYFSSADSAPAHDSFPDIYDFHGQVLPVTPTNFKVDIVDTHAKVSWEYEGPEPKSEISFKLTLQPGYTWREQTFHHLSKEYLEIRHLEPGTNYSVKVQAENRVGPGLFSEPFEFTIPEDAKINRPYNVTVTKVEKTSVNLKWLYDGDIKDDQYMDFGTLIEPGFKGKAEKQSVDISYEKFFDTIYFLEPYTDYKLTVFSQPNQARRYAEPVYVKTLPKNAYPHDVSVDEGDEFLMKLKCTGTGVPRPKVMWKVGRKDLPSVYQPKATFNEDGTVTSSLTLPRIQSNYATYVCNATNIGGGGERSLYLRYRQPEDKYIGDSIEDFVNHMKDIITGLREQNQQLEENNKNLTEALLEAAAATRELQQENENLKEELVQAETTTEEVEGTSVSEEEEDLVKAETATEEVEDTSASEEEDVLVKAETTTEELEGTSASDEED